MTSYINFLTIAAMVTTGLAIYAWRWHTVSAAMTFAWVMLGATCWSLVLILLHISENMEAAFFWSKVWYTNAASLPVLWMSFALNYIKRDQYLSFWWILGLMIVPLLTIVLVWTNQSHGLFWQSLSFKRVGFFMLPTEVVFGPWYIVHSLYSYLLMGLGVILIIRSVLRAPHLYRSQAVALMVGVTLPLIASIPSTFGWVKLETTSLGLTLSGVAVAWALFRYKFLDLVPVARDQVIDSMGDGMLVLDMHNRVVDLNPAMREIIEFPLDEVIGMSVNEVLQPWQQLVQSFRDVNDMQTEISLDRAGTQYHYDLRISPLTDHHQQITGRLVVLRDLTKRKRAERELQNYANELEVRNYELQRALRTIKTLSALVPICAWCGRKIQDDAGQWVDVQTYIEAHSEAKFTHGICPDCLQKLHDPLKRP